MKHYNYTTQQLSNDLICDANTFLEFLFFIAGFKCSFNFNSCCYIGLSLCNLLNLCKLLILI